MIVRKPYAFLIKNFRYIHMLLFLLLLFVFYKTYSIYNFFSFYARNHYYQYTSNLSGKYITWLLLLATLGVIALVAVIYYLLRLKDKKRKIYFIAGVYYILVLIFFIVMYNVLDAIENTNYAMTTIRSIRDLMVMAVYPQLPFIVIVLIRALGFNVKSFDFRKDLEEMEIDVTDNEEVEIILGRDNYKYARGFRKFVRQSKYVIAENRYIIIAISAVLTVGFIVFLIFSLRGITGRMGENDQFNAGRFSLKVTDTYITKYDMFYKTITKGKTYVLVNINVANKTDENIRLDRGSFKLATGGGDIVPEYNFENEFLDIGEVYNGQRIYSGDEKTYILVYEIDEKYSMNTFLLRVFNNATIKNGKLNADYKSVKIKPVNLDELLDTGNHFLPNEVLLGESTLRKTSINVTKYEVALSFKEKYSYCDELGNCYEGVKLLKPNIVGGGPLAVLKLGFELKVDPDLSFKKNLSSNAKFLDYFGTLIYRVKNINKRAKIKMVDATYKSDKFVYLEVPEEVKYATSLTIILQIRNVKYTLIVK